MPRRPRFRWEATMVIWTSICTVLLGLAGFFIPSFGEAVLRFANDLTPITRVILSGVEGANEAIVPRLRAREGAEVAELYDIRSRLTFLLWMTSTAAHLVQLVVLVALGRVRNALHRNSRELYRYLQNKTRAQFLLGGIIISYPLIMYFLFLNGSLFSAYALYRPTTHYMAILLVCFSSYSVFLFAGLASLFVSRDKLLDSANLTLGK